MSDRKERIKLALYGKSMSAAELARQIGTTSQELQKVIDGRVRRSKHLRPMAEALGVTVEWLNTGAGPGPEEPNLEELHRAIIQMGALAEWLKDKLEEEKAENARLKARLDNAGTEGASR